MRLSHSAPGRSWQQGTENSHLPLCVLHFLCLANTAQGKDIMSASPQLKCHPSPEYDSDTMLTRTVRNLEQAQGVARHRTTAAEIRQSPGNDEVDTPPPPPTNMSSPSPAPRASAADNASANQRAPAEVTTKAVLANDLTTSTALLQNLRARNDILAADLARHNRETAKQRRSRVKWKIVAIILFLAWVVYLWWCWHMCVEMEFIRRRRGEAFSGI